MRRGEVDDCEVEACLAEFDLVPAVVDGASAFASQLAVIGSDERAGGGDGFVLDGRWCWCRGLLVRRACGSRGGTPASSLPLKPSLVVTNMTTIRAVRQGDGQAGCKRRLS